MAAVGVVVPAHNEEALLPDCLDALERAMDRVAVPARTVLVLDACEDGSAAAAAGRPHLQTLAVAAHNVGRARAAGFDAVLSWAGATPLDQLWLATTDADSMVPEDWLTVQLELAARGVEAVLGTVRVVDWSERSPAVAQRFVARYQGRDDHAHVHGANMGMTAAAYLGAGGMPPLALAEDRGLALSLAGRRVLHTGRIPVTTSSRVASRAPGGFASYLDRLSG
ncbi:MAG TPA: glycosyltransferase [Candidatus Micrarchaeia archaeon]|nr:glycosyltransferase [Candidatus Micrarchaeia archaeon]